MDASVIAAGVSATGGILTVAGTIFTTVRSGKDKQDRRAERTVAEATADKIAEEKRKIAEETSDMVIARVNTELANVKEELIEAKHDLDKAEQRSDSCRELLQQKNNEIDMQARTIRQLTRRAEVLEEWITANAPRFRELGIQALPIDILGDRLLLEPKKSDED